MLKKLTKILTNNIGLKIAALAGAVILWLVVINIDDPTTTDTFTTAVTFENESVIAEMSKYYEVVDGSNTVSFRVTAKRSVMKNLSNSDFKAVADMKNLEDLSRVPIEITATRYSSQVTFLGKTQYLYVTVEDLKKKQLVVSAESTGTPAENCAIGDVTVSAPNVLKISGPASVVDTIASAKAIINVEGMSTSISDEVVPLLYDADGNLVDTTKLTLNLEKVSISATILDIKEVGLNFQTTGTPADGYSFLGVECTPSTVRIKGNAATLNTVNSIDIPAEIIDISGAQANITQTVDISTYLPEGVTLVDDATKKIEVTAKIEQIATKTFNVPTKDIEVSNLRSGYVVKYENTTVAITILGLESELSNLAADAFAPTIDLSDYRTAGTYEVPVAITLDETKYELNGNLTVRFTLEEETSEDEDESDSDKNTNNNDSTQTGGTTGTTGGTIGGTGTSGTTGGDGTTGGTSGNTGDDTSDGSKTTEDNDSSN